MTLQLAGESSLFSWLASQHPTALLHCCVSKQMSHRENLRKEHCFIERSIPFFPAYILSFWPPPRVSSVRFSVRKCRDSVSDDVRVGNFAVFNCNWKGWKKFVCFQMNHKGEVFVRYCHLWPCIGLKAGSRGKLCFRTYLLSLPCCLIPGTHVWCRVHTQTLWEVTAIIILS